MFYSLLKKTGKRILSKKPFTKYFKGNRFIFVYHDVSDYGSPYHSPYYSTDTTLFKKHVKFYKENFTLLPLNELIVEDLPDGKNYAALTFDDGFLSVKEVAYPILKREDISFTVFANKQAVLNNSLWFLTLLNSPEKSFLKLTYNSFKKYNSNSDISFDDYCKKPFEIILQFFSNRLADDIFSFTQIPTNKVFLNESDIKYLSDNGVMIGNHTIHHYNLSKCDDDTVLHEINDNRTFLEEIIQKKVIHFAIPFGKKEHYSKVVLEKHFKNTLHIYSSNPIRVFGKNIGDNFCLIPRVGITNQSLDEINFYINRTFIKTIDI